MGGKVSDFVLDGLAAYRLTRLVTTDRVSEPVRDRLVGHPVFGFVGEGIECDWCVGVWVGAGVAAAGKWWPAGWRVLRWGLALSVVAGAVGERLHNDD